MAGQVPTISLHALQRCRTTVEDFAASYLPLHGLHPHQGLLRFLDVLVYVSASLYELDEANERLCNQGNQSSSTDDEAALVARMEVVKAALREQGLLTAHVDAELDSGLRYWALERHICASLAHNAALRQEDVISCHQAKSFDYRVLHGVLIALLRTAPDAEAHAALLAFLRLDERLVDIGDDLTDYEDDVVANSFNILRCFISLYGTADAPLRLIELISELEAAHSAALQALHDSHRRHFWARHVEAASQPRSEKWVLPSPLIPIADEPAFRHTHTA